ncbi:MAG: hypothetical protein K9K30_01320 [Burkholderiaceae bacterium]|nr:hypothetical protein [Sulfuritalea sp.]MCF8173868.1 hypothetical protein [Burkholderiaceae bacterium]MCF8185099.1 hypothetical protein [Polynucleobacter sp.]
MKFPTALILLLSLTAPLPALADAIEAGVSAVRNLGTLNGQALACADRDAAAHAKMLMLAHSPKTARFGSAYEEATQEGYLAQARPGATCPDAKTRAGKIEEVAQQLRSVLPAAAPAAK